MLSIAPRSPTLSPRELSPEPLGSRWIDAPAARRQDRSHMPGEGNDSGRRAEVTRLLQADAEDRGELFQLIYGELRDIADQRMFGERAGHTLQATALVHEAWVRLSDHRQADWRDRAHFFSAASEAMRRILIDHARRVGAAKRGGDRERVTLGALESQVEVDANEAVLLAEALERLERTDPRAAEVTRLRFFSGLSVEETAQALGITARTVHREWVYARARLFEGVTGEAPSTGTPDDE